MERNRKDTKEEHNTILRDAIGNRKQTARNESIAENVQLHCESEDDAYHSNTTHGVDVGCAPQKTNKSKFLSSSLVQDIKKWFARWHVETYVDMPIEVGKEGDTLLNFELTALDSVHNKWKTAPHRSKFEYYCKHIHTKYWETYKISETQSHIAVLTGQDEPSL